MARPARWQAGSEPPAAAERLPAARLAGFDRYLELACLRGSSDGGSVPVSFFRSDDYGRHFDAEPFTSFGTLTGFRFALGAAGALIATGLCGTPSAGCSTGGLFVRREAPRDASRAKRQSGAPALPRAKFELFAAATPTMAESALGLTFSLNGRVAYAVARRSKTGALAIFVSHDGGRNSRSTIST